MSRKILSISSLVTLMAGVGLAEVPKVAVDIAPVHSLVAQVMHGVGEPKLVIPSGASPHEYQLRPSEAETLQNAHIIFWVGENLTPWLEDAMATLSESASINELLKADGINLLPLREDALFETHDHDHSEHAKKDDHEDHDDHDHNKHAKKDDHEDHGHAAYDPHAWLSPEIAKNWLNLIASELSAADPDNAGTYFSNAASARKELEVLSDRINKMLNSVRDRNFIVFHDAYQYFENTFNITASGAISLSDASDPSPGRLAEIRDRILDEKVHCVLAEPQFNKGLVKAVVEGSSANTGVIDPLGSDLETGPSLYLNLIRNMANTLSECL